MDEKINVGFIQYKPEIAKVERNFDQVERLLTQIKPEIELVVLPELAFTGYNFLTQKSILPFAESTSSSKTLDFLQRQAKKHQIYIVAGFPELEESDETRIFNSAMLVNPDGHVGTYRKVHLFGNEKNIFEPGLEFLVFPLISPKSKVHFNLGMLICFDWIFAESWLIMFHKGADAIAHCTNLVLPGRAQKAVPAMSMMHKIPVILSNRYGDEASIPQPDPKNSLNFTGNSIITDALGEIQASAPQSEDFVGFASLRLNDSRKKQITDQNNLILDRMPDVYKKNGITNRKT